MSSAGETEPPLEAVLRCRPRIPDDVAQRAFPGETVLLNLRTGQYHGLNETGGAMVEELGRAGSVAEVAERLSERYELPLERLEEDVGRFCRALEQRGLLELDAP